MKKPIVSILMTIYNHENFLKKSINSVINQTFKNWELIAIDNGSEDNSKEILKKIREKRVKKKYLKKNIGRTKCLNLGLKLCKGKYIAILDSDDIARKNRIAFQINRMKKNKKLWLTSSSYTKIDDKNRILEKVVFKEDLKKKPRKLLYNNIIAHSTVLYRKKLIQNIGDYPRKFQYAQDYAFYLKTFKNYDIEIVKNDPVKLRTPHKSSETFRKSKTSLISLEELKLIYWVVKNFKLSQKEIFKIFIVLFKKVLKLIKLNSYIILIPLIIFFLSVSFFE